ncbi:tyrosine-type recombinase/integrase [Deinococcus marmoris]|uniref:tyrosine-type recombinase/integrase n=1 Tax=Deinococcus marmoris TaxID=249408 RepID=UPI00138DF501|nr:site-specific integrase [Deinococcus marmoris]
MSYLVGVAKKRGHGHGQYTDLPSGRVGWRVRVTYPDGTKARPSGTANNKMEAYAAVRAKQDEADAGQRPVSRSLTVGQMVEEYIEAKRPIWRPKTGWDNEYLLVKYIMPELGHAKAAGVRSPRIRTHYQHLDRLGLGTDTQRLVRSLLNGAYKRAIADGILTHNPMTHAVPTVQRGPGKVKAFTPDQARIFLKAALEDRWALGLAFMLLTGIRPGEMIALHWADFEPDKHAPTREDGTPGAIWAHIQRTRVEHRGRVSEGPPKTPKSNRFIHLSGAVLDILDAMRVHLTFEGQAHGQGPPIYVFPSTSGKPLRHDSARGIMHRTCERAGLPMLSPHALRHTFATLGHAQGFNIAALSRQLGHSLISTTLDIYRHDFLDERRGMVLDLGSQVEQAEGPVIAEVKQAICLSIEDGSQDVEEQNAGGKVPHSGRRIMRPRKGGPRRK